MLQCSLSPLPALAAFGLSIVVMTAGHAVADSTRISPDPALAEELRQTCRSGGALSLAGPPADAQEIITRHDNAVAACTQLIDSGRLTGRELAAALLDRADLLAPGTGDAYARALADYDRAIALEPKAAIAFSKRGKAHLLYARNLKLALRDLDAAIRLDPSQADFLVTRASIQAWLKQPDRALADLDRAVALAPTSEKARSVRGLTHLDQGRFAKAIADFDEAIRLAPNAGENFSFRAAARRAAGDPDGARADEAQARALTSSGQTPAQR